MYNNFLQDTSNKDAPASEPAAKRVCLVPLTSVSYISKLCSMSYEYEFVTHLQNSHSNTANKTVLNVSLHTDQILSSS